MKQETWEDVLKEKPKRHRHIINGKRIYCHEYPYDPFYIDYLAQDETVLPEEEWKFVER